MIKLLDTSPNFHNFYQNWSQPLTSYSIQSLVNYKSDQEKLEMFRHLEENVARVLNMERTSDMTDMMDNQQQECQDIARYGSICKSGMIRLDTLYN